MTAWLRGARDYCQAYHGASNRQEIIDELVNSKTDAAPELLEKYPVAGAQPERQDQHREHARHQQAGTSTNKMSTQGIPGVERLVDSSYIDYAQSRSSGRSSCRTRTASCRAAAERGEAPAGEARCRCNGAARRSRSRACAANTSAGRARVVAIDHVDLQRRARRIPLHRRPERLREIDAAAHPRRPRQADRPAPSRSMPPAGRSRTPWCSRTAGCFPG